MYINICNAVILCQHCFKGCKPKDYKCSCFKIRHLQPFGIVHTIDILNSILA